MRIKCTAYVWPDGTVMVHQSGDKDHLEKWIHPDEKKKAEKVTLTFEANGIEKRVLGIVVNQ